MLALGISAVVILLLVLLLLPLYLFRYSRVARLTAHVPGPEPLPFIGNAHQFGKGPVEFMEQMTNMWQKYGRVFKIWLGPKMFVMTAKPEHLEVFLSSSTNLSKNVTYKFLHGWLGTGLITSTGKKWKGHRKMITPAFHFKILEQFTGTFQYNSDKLVKKLRVHLNGPSFEVYDYLTLAALDIICETALGVSVNAQEDSNSEYVISAKEMSNMVTKRSFTPWMFFDSLFNLSEDGKRQRKYLQVLHDTTRKVIQRRKAEYLKNKENESVFADDIGQKKKLALLDVLLECSRNENYLTDEEIREEVDTFMFAGHDTTASAMAFCLFLLGSHSDIQEKAYSELQEIFGESQRETSFRDLQEMKYLECVIKESLRMFPSVPVFGRELTEDVQIDDLELPAGTNVAFLAFYLHQDSNIYPNPKKFDPDRFLSANIQGRHPFAYIPFSAGPRNCIGQKFAMLEMKSLIASILRNYKVIADKNVTLELGLEVVLRSRRGVYLRIEERL